MQRPAIVLVVVAFGCAQESAPNHNTDAARGPAPRSIRAPVRVVDLGGKPAPGIIPIATRQANAFDQPFSKGELTGPDGRSSLSIHPGEHVFVRGWDPTLTKFANNYIEVLPVHGNAIDEMVLVMVSGAALEAVLLTPDGIPAAHAEVRLMMIHPTEGPWWPDKAVTDKDGLARFDAAPAGKFTIEISAEDVGQTALADVTLPPESTVQLGPIVLEKKVEVEHPPRASH